jgi:hypothetical protein
MFVVKPFVCNSLYLHHKAIIRGAEHEKTLPQASRGIPLKGLGLRDRHPAQTRNFIPAP